MRDVPPRRADGLIAATALTHGLTVVTRNVKDFEDTAAIIVNPFAIRSAGVEGAQELFGGYGGGEGPFADLGFHFGADGFYVGVVGQAA